LWDVVEGDNIEYQVFSGAELFGTVTDTHFTVYNLTHGGAGGNGITAATVLIAMDIAGLVGAYGGGGGVRGEAGANGSILSGPMLTAAWGRSHGNPGAAGISVSGALTRVSGMFLTE
jgi:hypothetical protein